MGLMNYKANDIILQKGGKVFCNLQISFISSLKDEIKMQW